VQFVTDSLINDIITHHGRRKRGQGGRVSCLSPPLPQIFIHGTIDRGLNSVFFFGPSPENFSANAFVTHHGAFQ